MLPATTLAVEGEGLEGIFLRNTDEMTSSRYHNGRAYADVAAGKPGVPVGTPHPDRSLPPLLLLVESV